MAMQEVSSGYASEHGEVERFKFENEGDTIEGYLIEKASFTHKKKDITKYVFKTADGIISTLGSVKLIELLSKVEVGTKVRVTYIGEVETKSGNTMKNFKVLMDTEDRLAS